MVRRVEKISHDDATSRASIERLAIRLHDRMEHLDPTLNGSKWGDLSDHEREFYRLCIEDLLMDEELILKGLS